MCQRVAIALAIMNQPSLLLADEPTSALDVASQDMTIETLLALRKKTDLSILLVTHNMEVARRLADEIGVMYQGRIIESGLPEEIWNDPKVAARDFLYPGLLCRRTHWGRIPGKTSRGDRPRKKD